MRPVRVVDMHGAMILFSLRDMTTIAAAIFLDNWAWVDVEAMVTFPSCFTVFESIKGASFLLE